MLSEIKRSRLWHFVDLAPVRDATVALILALLAIWLFRGHFFGDSLWIGNPDRLNSDLKILAHYVSGQFSGHIPAWDTFEMMGYDSFVLPYTFPNPLVNLVSSFGQADLYVCMGYVTIGMLFCAGAAAYAFLRALLPAGLATLVGAICYEFSSLTILKDSQNSMSFAVFIVIPLLALGIRNIRRGTEAWCFLALALLSGCMLSLMFLQKAAYALMLTGSYAAWRSYIARSWRPLIIFSTAVAVATAFSFPRILGIGLALREYSRAVPGVDLKDFDVLYSFQNIYPYEILRWFDYSIFGRSPSDSVAMGNNINLTEGFLLSTSSVVPFLLLVGLVRSRLSWLNVFRSSRNEESFFFWILALCISVIVAKPAAHAMFLLFLRMDFTHARILISALLPLAVLVSASLSSLSAASSNDAGNLRQSVAGLLVGLLTALAIEAIAMHFKGTVSNVDLLFGDPLQVPDPSEVWQASRLRVDALERILLSGSAFFALLWATLRRDPRMRRGAYVAICTLLAGQCLIAANRQINGPQVFNFSRPFNMGDSYQARREEFALPSEEQLAALHRRIEPERYRVALVCDRAVADGFCAGHVPEYWQLRAIDGYYGLGVPSRLRTLPWPNGVSLRTISFTSLAEMPWDLLGFLNVRWALVGSDGVFRNIVREDGRVTGRADPSRFEIVESPARVTPRAFFAATVKPVASPEEAARQLFRPEGIVDPTEVSFVEGLVDSRSIAGGGPVTVDTGPDSMTLNFDAATGDRYLVVNDLFFPGWHAEADGRELRVYATNAVMRGVVVPSGVKRLHFYYVSYVDTTSAKTLRILSVLLLVGLFIAIVRKTRRSSQWGAN